MTLSMSVTFVAKLGRNSKRYRTAIRGLRKAAQDIKIPLKKLYDDKIPHLKAKYRETEDEKLDKIPAEIEEYITLSVFDREKYDRVEALTYEVTCIGDVKLFNDKKKAYSPSIPNSHS